MNRAATLGVGVLLALISGATYAAVDGSAATSCGSTVAISGPKVNDLTLSPSATKITVGECVAFKNETVGLVAVSISKAGQHVYSTTITKGTTTTVARSYTPTNPGKATVTATTTILLFKHSGSGTVTVDPAPSHSPTATASPKSSGHHSTHPTKKPTKSKTPKPTKSKIASATPHATGYKLPPLPPLPTAGISALPRGSSPVVAPGLTSIAPVTTESSTPVAAVVGGPLETAENDSRGLPIAVAVLVVLGLASGYGRVLLATPGGSATRSAKVRSAKVRSAKVRSRRPAKAKQVKPATAPKDRPAKAPKVKAPKAPKVKAPKDKRPKGSVDKRPKGSVDKRPKGSVDKRPKGDHRV